jgi:hypothetical protein
MLENLELPASADERPVVVSLLAVLLLTSPFLSLSHLSTMSSGNCVPKERDRRLALGKPSVGAFFGSLHIVSYFPGFLLTY